MGLTEEQVKSILLMPLECTSQESEAVFEHEGRLFSSQAYKGLDPDMSDLAVEFYKIIYNEQLGPEGEILKGRQLIEQDFCGDTMNSYRNMAKRLPDHQSGAWQGQYHCLANFWLLPMHVGHSSPHTARRGLMKYSKSMKGTDDYVDRFLKKYLEDYDEYVEKFPKYAAKFQRENFAEAHYLDGIYMEAGEVILFSYPSDEEISGLPDQVMEKIRRRAELIANKKGDELARLFSRLGIRTCVHSR